MPTRDCERGEDCGGGETGASRRILSNMGGVGFGNRWISDTLGGDRRGTRRALSSSNILDVTDSSSSISSSKLAGSFSSESRCIDDVGGLS